MYAIRKFNLQQFTCRSESVCRIQEGNTNKYLIEPRKIEEFMKDIEPKYNVSLQKIRRGEADQNAIYVIAGFICYLQAVAPAGMRIHSEPLRQMLEAQTRVLDSQGLIPRAPAALGSKSISELLSEGTIRHSVDQKYPQALGVDTFYRRLSIFGNSAWEILINEHPTNPFFTSDYPIGIERIQENPMIVHRVVPLAPDLAVRIKPDIRFRDQPPDFTFQGFRFAPRALPPREVRYINQLIVRCAEDLIFYREDLPWIQAFVRKNRNYRIEAITDRIPMGGGYLSISGEYVTPYAQGG